MFSLLVLLLLLLILAGLIAYAGDLLGTYIGKKRLSLFGWRPKRTGRVVGIAAGVLIMLSTMGILSLAFRDATGVILRAQRTAHELTGLRQERKGLEAQVAEVRSELAAARKTSAEAIAARDLARTARDAALRTRERTLREQQALHEEVTQLSQRTRVLGAQQQTLLTANRGLQEKNTEVALANESLSAKNAQLSRQNASFENTFNNLQNQVVTLDNQLRALRSESERQAQNLRDTLAQFEAASGSELTYRQGEIVYSQVIAAKDVSEISRALQSFVGAAQQEVITRGASGLELNTDQLNSLIAATAASPAGDLVTLVAASNYVGTAQVKVNVEARENLRLMREGQLVAVQRVYVGGEEAPMSRAGLRAEVARLTQASLNRLQRIGLFEQVRPLASEADLNSFVASLTRLRGAVEIGTIARNDVFVAGPADLDYIILY